MEPWHSIFESLPDNSNLFWEIPVLTSKGFSLWAVVAVVFEQGQKNIFIFECILSKYSIKMRIQDLILPLHKPLGNFPTIFMFCKYSSDFYFSFYMSKLVHELYSRIITELSRCNILLNSAFFRKAILPLWS